MPTEGSAAADAQTACGSAKDTLKQPYFGKVICLKCTGTRAICRTKQNRRAREAVGWKDIRYKKNSKPGLGLLKY